MSGLKASINHDFSRITVVVFLCLFVLSASSCNKPFLSKIESISKILESPSKFQDKIVTVKGKVTESIIAFGLGYFVLSDGTGSIAIIPSKTFPKVGEEVKIKGTVKNAFVIGDKSLSVILEQEKE